MTTPKDADSRTFIVIGLLLVAAPWGYTLEQWAGLTWRDPGELFWGISICALMATLLLAPAWLIAGLVHLVKPRNRAQAVWMVCTGALAVASLAGARGATGAIRHRVFADLAHRSMPLVEAIKTYETTSGAPPASLEALVPGHLPAIPGTGIPLYPKYTYRLKSFVEPNHWELYVPCGFGPLNWDQFLSLPEQNYPAKGYGGTLERMGDWAYVHE